MKVPSVAIVLCLVAVGCHWSSAPAQRTVVTTPTGRKAHVTRQYTINEIEGGLAATKISKNPFDIRHPVYPQKKDIEELKQHLKAGDQIWYFQGLDSGWAIIRSGEVVQVLVTNHEY